MNRSANTKGAWNINFVERFSKPFTRIGNPGYKTRSDFSSPPKDRRINNCRSRSRQTSDLNSGEFSYIRQLFLRRP